MNHSKYDMLNAILGHILEVQVLFLITITICWKCRVFDSVFLQLVPRLLLWKDNQYFYKTENSLKEQKLGIIEMDYEKKLFAAKHTLELAETEQAKEKSEKESCQNKILELEYTQAQLTEKIKK